MLNYEIQMGEYEREPDEFDGQGNPLARNPFPGLRPFSIDEYHLFFGREGQVDEILVKLASCRFVAVMGYSGSGKSSLMYCGLVPALLGGFLNDVSGHWNVLVSRPGTSPIDNLAEALVAAGSDAAGMSDEKRKINRTAISSLLRSDSQGLAHLIASLKREKGGNTLILIDQFEELFRYRSSQDKVVSEESKIYVNLILEACKQRETPVYLAITMRSDYVGDCAKYPGLTDMINQSNYLVPQMTREEKRMVIEGPVAVGGGRISPRLVKNLLNEIGDNQDQLPILQHALMRTWDYWVRTREDNESIDIRHYNAVGKIAEALSQHANEAYDELSAREKEVAETLFKSLTQRTNDSFGMRRPVRLGLVAELAGVNDQEVIRVVEKFRQPGRSFLMPPSGVPLHAGSIIEISHESLMRIWNRLKKWVDEEHESAQMYRRLSDAAAMYQVGRTGLWRPPDLQLALNWQKKQRPTRAWAQRYDEAFERAIVFLDTSRITYEAEQRNQEMLQKRLLNRTKLVAVGLGVAALISILFFLFAVTRNIEANKQREQAEKERRAAIASERVAQEQKSVAQRQREIAIAQEEIAKEQAEKAKEALLTAQEQRKYAEQQTRIAEEQRTIADSQKEAAHDAQEEAEEQFERAETNFVRAEKLLYQSVSQSMAVKSLTIEDDNLKGLLAKQAYLFNQQYEGRTYDPYVYSALYSALTQLKGAAFNSITDVHRNAVRSVVFRNNSNDLYSTGSAGKIAHISLGGNDQHTVVGFNEHPNRVLAVSSDDRWLACGSDSSAIKIYDLHENSSSPKIIRGHNSFINDIAFLPGKSEFVSSGGDHELRLNDVISGSSTLLIKGDEQFKTLAIHPDGGLLAAGTLHGAVIILNLSDLSQKRLLLTNGAPVQALAFSPDSKFLAIGDEKGAVRIWNLQTRAVEYEFTGQKGRISALAYSKDGRLLAASSLDKTVQMWVTAEMDELPVRMADHNSYVWDVAFSPDSQYIVAACGDGQLRIWPTRPELMADEVCSEVTRNLTEEEWKAYIGNDISYRTTCVNLLLNDYK